MATRALDIVTILHALNTLAAELKISNWQAHTPQQQRVVAWLDRYRARRMAGRGLDALASRSWQDLNRFLIERSCDPMIAPFDPAGGIGVVSVLDQWVRWLHGSGALVTIATERGPRPGVALPSGGVTVYTVAGYPGSYLLALLTTSEATLWLFAHDARGLDDLALVELSMEVMRQPRAIPTRPVGGSAADAPLYAGAQVPMLEIDLTPDLNWLRGADMITQSGGRYRVAQAVQRFKMRLDETGARVKVATGMVARRSVAVGPVVFRLNRPFYGWWTQRGLALPMAAFFADWDALHHPAGRLADL